MITLDNGMITVKNWQKRQETNLTSYERLKKHREKKKKIVINDNAMITLDKNRIDKKRVYKNTNAPKTAQGEFILKEYFKRMENDKRRHVNVIGHYFEEKGLKFNNEAEAQSAIRRHLRPAIEVAKFTDKDIVRATDQAKKEYGEKFTIETIWKVLTR